MGMDPYAYVGNNPETWMDPSGQMPIANDGTGGGIGCMTSVCVETETPPVINDNRGPESQRPF